MQIDVKESETGYLFPIDFEKLPFTPKRAFVVTNKNKNVIRGRHAHINEQHYLICLNGKVQIKFESADLNEVFFMGVGNSLYQKELEWLEIEFVEEQTMLLVFADKEFNENRYVRDYEEFKRMIRGKRYD